MTNKQRNIYSHINNISLSVHVQERGSIRIQCWFGLDYVENMFNLKWEENKTYGKSKFTILRLKYWIYMWDAVGIMESKSL